MLQRALAARAPCNLGAIDAPTANEHAWATRAIDAHDVADQIQVALAGSFRFELNGAHIRGTLSLRDAKNEIPIRLTSCWIEGGLDLDFGTLSDLSVEGSVLGPGAKGLALSARFVTISGDLCLARAAIAGGCQLVGATIKGSLDAPRAQMPARERGQWAMDLTNAKVLGDLTLNQCQLGGGVCLAGASVTGQINLIGATISAGGRRPGGEAAMSDYSAIWGQGCHVGESVLAYPPTDESRTVFTGYVSFVSAKVDGQVNFRRADFRVSPGPGLEDGERPAAFGSKREWVGLDLYNCKIGGSLELTDAISTAPLQVDLRNCGCDRFTPGNALWPAGQYGVFGLTYRTIAGTNRARRQWIKKAADGRKPGPYLTLAAAAHNVGEPRDEMKAKIRASSEAAHRLEKLFLGWVRYGYRPYLVIVPLLLLGCVAFLQVDRTLKNAHGFVPVVVAGKDFSPGECDAAKVPCIDRKLYALDSVIPVDQHQVSTWRPDRRTKAGNFLHWVVTVNRLAAWLLAGVFVAAVGGFLKRT